jgi:uncharacterized protein (DUF1800 family)
MTWTEEHVRRLHWRAGFGARPDEASRGAAVGQDAAIRALFTAKPVLAGPAPTVDGGKPIDPYNEWSHDALWWLDRMIRSQKPLEEKLTLFWHDHFATSDQDTPLMLAQNRMLRANAFGSFRTLLGKVTNDRAMQLFLSLADSPKEAPNENFARELMELFTLGGGYTERDVREAARALTGYQAKWRDNGPPLIRFNPEAHDDGVKRIFGHKGRFGPDDVLDLVVAHPRHAAFLTRKLWDFFVADPPDAATARNLQRVYRKSGLKIAPVVEAILRHPALYARLDAPDLVKCPIVYVAGTLRLAGRGITIGDYGWLLDNMGQMPFHPPSVAGWDWGAAWLSSGTVKWRLQFSNGMIGWDDTAPLVVEDGAGDPTWSAEQQVENALDALGRPWLSAAGRAVLVDLAAGFFADMTKSWQQGEPKQERADVLQRLLRNLILSGPDAHLH